MSRIQSIIAKKNQIETELQNLENQIFDLETNYLEDTYLTGNIIKGWDNYLQSKQKNYVNFFKKNKINPQERIFSLSSVTSPAFKFLNQENNVKEQSQNISKDKNNKQSEKENKKSKNKINKQIKKKKRQS